jgi:hypothetical protein
MPDFFIAKPYCVLQLCLLFGLVSVLAINPLGDQVYTFPASTAGLLLK